MISYSIRAVLLATAFAVSTVAAVPHVYAASFDGPWSVTVITRRGPCDAAYRYGIMVRGGAVTFFGGGPVSVSGRVSPSGQVSVSVSSASQNASGSGRLSNNSGGGTWRGNGPTGTCSGVWSASRG